MKTIPLKDFSVTQGDQTQSESAVKMLRAIVLFVDPHKGGATFEDQYKRSRILTVLDKAKPDAKQIALEDQDAATLAQCVREMRWSVISTEILDWTQGIIDACNGKADK